MTGCAGGGPWTGQAPLGCPAWWGPESAKWDGHLRVQQNGPKMSNEQGYLLEKNFVQKI